MKGLKILTLLMALISQNIIASNLITKIGTSIEIKHITPENDSTQKQILIEKVRERGTIRVWVHYDLPYFEENLLTKQQAVLLRQQIDNFHSNFIQKMRGQNLRIGSINKMKLDPLVALYVDEEALTYLFNSPEVKKVTEVRQSFYYLSESTAIVGADKAQDLGFTGKDQVVVIIDSGVDYTHTMFGDRVIDGACFSSWDPYGDDPFYETYISTCPGGSAWDSGVEAGDDCDNALGCGHGTNVAGIVGGHDASLSGVAPDVKLISIKNSTRVEDDTKCGGDAPCLTIVDDNTKEALDWIFNVLIQQNNYNIVAVNMSFGRSPVGNECTTGEVVTSVNNLLGAGVNVVAASGNEGSDEVSWPACIDGVISVGATNDQDTLWTDSSTGEGSNTGEGLDLVAPGVNIESAAPGGGTAGFTGTSQAAPHVTGTIALMKEAYPGLGYISVTSILHQKAFWDTENMGFYDPPSDEYGYGRLDTYSSVIQTLYDNPQAYVPDDDEIYANDTLAVNTYVLEDFTFNIQGTVTLDKNIYGPSYITVIGDLAAPSNATLNLIDDSDIKILSEGELNFLGRIVKKIEDEAAFNENRTFGSSYDLKIESGGTLYLEEGTSFSIEPGATFTMEANTEIVSTSGLQKGRIDLSRKRDGEDDDTKDSKDRHKDLVGKDKSVIPGSFELLDNYPNPFNPETIIRYNLPVQSQVRLEVFDLLGRKVAELVNQQQAAGSYSVRWNASQNATGIYIYRIHAGEYVQTKQMLLIK